MAAFHHCHGNLIFLSNQSRNARRRNATTEFNNGVVFSRAPLEDGDIFEVRLDKKMGSWSGSFAIGVTTGNPDSLEIPPSATGLKNGSWLMSGKTVLKDGSSLLKDYGQDLDELNEGDIIGVQRQTDNSLHFYVNGVNQGIAARTIPSNVYAVVDVYGKCVEVSACQPFRQSVPGNQAMSTASVVFHPHCGSLVTLCNNNRTAERKKPNEEFKNAVTLTSLPLRDDQMFEVEVEAMTDMWAGSLEVGVTTHNPEQIALPPTMTSMSSGTWMLSGTSLIVNGQEIKKNYAPDSLEGLQVKDRVGFTRRSNGCLHFFVNGVDQGVAALDIPPGVYGVVDLYGAAVKVSIIDSNQSNDNESGEGATAHPPGEALRFHRLCGGAVSVSQDGGTAVRPRALEEFNNAIVLTSRPLLPSELFEVRIDRKVDKWAGSLEIGVTTHAPEALDFPSTMTNVPSGTWMFSGGSVVQNGVTIAEDYLDTPDDDKAVGDTAGVLRKPDGALHFFFNGRDLGVAARGVPPRVYGVVDLYGRSAQATITSYASDVRPAVEVEVTAATERSTEANTSNSSHTPESTSDASNACADPSSSANENWFRFSEHHGGQVAVSRDMRSAVRINPLCEFNNAIVMSDRPLRDGELFEVTIDKLVDRWSGSLEAGVTTMAPRELDFPGTMTDLARGTWVVSSASVIQDGETIMNGYACDLDKLSAGSRLGLMRKADGTLHFFVNGEDCGAAASSVPPGVYAMIDLYGQCVQISIYDEDSRGTQASSSIPAVTSEAARTVEETPVETPNCFHACCGKNISLSGNKRAAVRKAGYSHGLVFSANPLDDDDLFEIKVDRLHAHWSGSLAVGVTSAPLPLPAVPLTAAELKEGAWVVSGSRVRKDSVVVKENYGVSLDRVQRSMRVGLQRRSDASLHVYVNGLDQGVAAYNLPRVVYALVDVYGAAQAVSIARTSGHPSSSATAESKTKAKKGKSEVYKGGLSNQRVTFHKSCGAHVRLDSTLTTARRVKSFNHGTVVSGAPLLSHQAFQVRIKKVNSRWTGSLMIGVTDQDPDSLSDLPSTASSIAPWIVVSNTVYVDGRKVIDDLPRSLDSMREGDTVGVVVDGDNSLFLLLNGERLGPLAQALPARRYAVLDLYGSCEEVAIVTAADQFDRGLSLVDEAKATGEHAKGPCDYRQLCERFKASLAIPGGFFCVDSKMNVCYCQTCHEARGEKRYAVSGDPPCRYALPISWSQFAFRIPPRHEASFAFDKWHVAFYGSHVGKIRRILDMGDLPVPNCSHDVSRHMSGSSNKNTPAPQLMVSPTILCVTSDTPHEFRDVTTGKCYSAQVALRLCVRPGAYKNGEPGCEVATNELLDQNLATESLGWFIQDAGVVTLTALLIKVEPT